MSQNMSPDPKQNPGQDPHPGQDPRSQQPAGPDGQSHPSPEDLVLYAMQLLTAQQSSVIARHLSGCGECSAELARIHGDLVLYALTAESQSPAAPARERLMAQVAREKKIIPMASAQKPAAEPKAATSTQRPLTEFGRSGTVFASEPLHMQNRPRRPVLAWSGWAVAAALAVTSGVLYRDHRALNESLAIQNSQNERLAARAASSRQLMDALTDPQAVRVTLTPKPPPHPGPVAGVTYNPRKGSLVFLASNLDPVQSYKTYELWVIPSDGGAPIPAGTFHPDDHGSASVIMPDLPKGITAKAFGVTIEDAGGADKPTLPIIMSGS